MALALDPSLKFRLQQHLVNAHHASVSKPFEVGTADELTAIGRIRKIHSIFNCTHGEVPTFYPSLAKGNHLVAIFDQWFNKKVVAVYTLEQMQQFYFKKNNFVKSIRWRVLTLPDHLESELVKGVFLDKGVIITERGPLWIMAK